MPDQPAQQIDHITVADEHRVVLSRLQYVLEDLQADKQRLEVELRHVLQRGQQKQEELVAWLQQIYHIDISRGFQLDAEHGEILVPHPAPDPAAAPATESADIPAAPIAINRTTRRAATRRH